MDRRTLLIELEEAFDRLFCGLNAVQLMIYGLESVQSPYAEGFHTVWLELSRAETEVKRLLDSVSAPGATA